MTSITAGKSQVTFLVCSIESEREGPSHGDQGPLGEDCQSSGVRRGAAI